MILSIFVFFQNIKLKYFSPQIIEFKNQDDSEVLNSDFTGLRSTAASLTSAASATSLASTASTALFSQKTS